MGVLIRVKFIKVVEYHVKGKKMISKVFRTLFCNGGVWAVVVILSIELLAEPLLSTKYVSHEVDWTIRALKVQRQNQNVVVIGDSVGHGIFGGWESPEGRVANLACNQATETAGQFFFLRRFVENNTIPGAVISCDRTPFSGNLQQDLTENYVQRVFTNWNEIFDLFVVKKDPVFTLKMIAYKFFASYKYRLHLQKELVGFTNTPIYTGVANTGTHSSSTKSIVTILSRKFDYLRPESISAYFLQRMIRYTEHLNIPIYYIPPPPLDSSKEAQDLISFSLQQFKTVEGQHESVHVLSDLEVQYQGSYYYSDGVHLNDQGLNIYRRFIEPKVDQILTTARKQQNENITEAFNRGLPIFESMLQIDISDLQTVNDSILEQNGARIYLSSRAGDPALLLPGISSFKIDRNGRVVLRVSISSPRNTVAKLYYASNKNNGFNEAHSLRQTVVTGDNIIYFVFPRKFDGGTLRFDPGETKGKYILKDFEFRVTHSDIIDNYAMFGQ